MDQKLQQEESLNNSMDGPMSKNAIMQVEVTADNASIDANTPDHNDNSNVRLMSGLRLYVCVAALVLATFIFALDVFIVNTIIDSVSASLGGYSKSGWLIAGYSLPNSLFSLIWGRTASLLGFQASMTLSIFIFEVGSIVSASATSMDNLIVGRVIAGVGGSGLQTLSLVIGSSIVEEKNRAMIVSIVMSAFAAASLIGPFVGGAFTTHVIWRWCFWINLPIGAVTALLFYFTYNPKRLSAASRFTSCFKSVKALSFEKLASWETYRCMGKNLLFRFDIVGFATGCAGVCLLLLGLTLGGEDDSWKSAIVICFLIVGFLLSVLSVVYDFYIFDKINPEPSNLSFRPMLVKGLLNNRFILLPNLVTCASAIAFSGYMLYSVQFFQLVMGSSAWNAGLHLIPLVIASIVSAVICGGIMKKTGQVKPLMISTVSILLIGGGVSTLLDNHSGNSMQIGVWILPGFGLGAALQCALISSQLQIDKESPNSEIELVEVTAFNSFTKSLGSSIGGVLCTAIFTSSLWSKINAVKLEGYYGKSTNEFVKYRLQHFDSRYSEASTIFSDSVTNVFWMALAFAAFAFVCSCLSSTNTVEIADKQKVHSDRDMSLISDSKLEA